MPGAIAGGAMRRPLRYLLAAASRAFSSFGPLISTLLGLGLGRRRLEVRRRCRAFAEEELLALAQQELDALLRADVDAELVDDHRRVREPVLPGVLRDALVDALTERVLEGGTIETGQLAAELRAL